MMTEQRVSGGDRTYPTTATVQARTAWLPAAPSRGSVIQDATGPGVHSPPYLWRDAWTGDSQGPTERTQMPSLGADVRGRVRCVRERGWPAPMRTPRPVCAT